MTLLTNFSRRAPIAPSSITKPLSSALLLGISSLLMSQALLAKDYQIILSGRQAGSQTVEYQSNGEASMAFEYNDRGRGEKMESLLTLNEQGLPTSVSTTGNDYMKAPVSEEFSLSSGTASWHSDGEQGEQASAEGFFYVPLNIAPEISGVLARALLASPNHSLPLLPAGEGRIREMERRQIDVAGEPHEVVLYFIEGLGFSPEPIWLEANGDTFAIASSWFSILPAEADAEALLPELLDTQQLKLDEYSATLAKQLSHRPANDVLIRHARLYDPKTLQVQDDMAVLVSGQRIAAIGTDSELHQRLSDDKASFKELDAQQRFVMPGLWDSHQHFGDITGQLDLASGVTSARDLANDNETLLARKARFDAGSELGPRVYLGGFMDGPGPLAGPTKVLVDEAEEAEYWVDWYAQRGYRQIKVYSSLKPELVDDIARVAHKNGMRLSGHVPAYMSAQEFIEAGADEIQHLNMLFLNFLTDIAPDTRDTTRFTAVGEHAHEINASQPRVKALIKLMQDHNTALDPTAMIFEGMFSGKPNDPPPGMAHYLPRVPPQVSRGWLSGALPIPEGQEQAYAQAFPSMLKLLKALHDAGIPIVAGTDAMPGFSLFRELELYVEAGLTPVEALRTATLTPAEVMGVNGQYGRLVPGQFADLIVIDGQPDQNISDIQRVQLVVKGGTFYEAQSLQHSMGVKPIVEPFAGLAEAMQP